MHDVNIIKLDFYPYTAADTISVKVDENLVIAKETISIDSHGFLHKLCWNIFKSSHNYLIEINLITNRNFRNLLKNA